jgi:Putative restriction endonuclease
MMPPTMTPGSIPLRPEVDDRLVIPETRFEIEDGRRVFVPPADEPHAESHASLAAVLKAHRAPGFSVAADMLTRTSPIDDLAPDASVYPTARNPATGGRQLEVLAFEVASTESLPHAATRAAKLVARGVRRVFAIDLEHARALEWSPQLGRWSIFDRRARIEDPALAVPIPIAALLDATRADDAIPRAHRLKRHPEFLAERAEGLAEGEAKGRVEGLAVGEAKGRVEGLAVGEAKGRAESLLIVLASRGLVPTEAERHRILEESDLGRLDRWLAAAATCAGVAALLAGS